MKFHPYSAEVACKAPRARIFEVYKDVEHWKLWDTELEYSNIYGKFENGTRGVLKANGQNEFEFELKEVVKDSSFKQVISLPLGGSFILYREIITQQDASKQVLRHGGYFEGLGGFFIGFFIKLQYQHKIKDTLEKFKEIVEL